MIKMIQECIDYNQCKKVVIMLNKYHKNLVETYEKYPNIFDPNFVVKMNEESLKNIIVNHIHPRYPMLQ